MLIVCEMIDSSETKIARNALSENVTTFTPVVKAWWERKPQFYMEHLPSSYKLVVSWEIYHFVKIVTQTCLVDRLFCFFYWNVFFCRFLLTSMYTQYNKIHFVLNAISLGFVIVPKLPQLHKVRLFNLNKYWQNELAIGPRPTWIFHIFWYTH